MNKMNYEYRITKFNAGDKKEIADLVKKFNMPVVPGTTAFIDWFRKDIPLDTWKYVRMIFDRLPGEMRTLNNLLTVLELRFLGLQSSAKNVEKVKNHKFKEILEKQIPVTKKECLDIICEVKQEIKKREAEANKSFLEQMLV